MHRPVSTNPHTNVDIGGIASLSVIHLGSGISFIFSLFFLGRFDHNDGRGFDILYERMRKHCLSIKCHPIFPFLLLAYIPTLNWPQETYDPRIDFAWNFLFCHIDSPLGLCQ